MLNGCGAGKGVKERLFPRWRALKGRVPSLVGGKKGG